MTGGALITLVRRLRSELPRRPPPLPRRRPIDPRGVASNRHTRGIPPHPLGQGDPPPPNAVAYWHVMRCWITDPFTAEALAAQWPDEIITVDRPDGGPQ